MVIDSMKKQIKCQICEAEIDKNTIGLNKKFHGRQVKKFFCLDCLSEHLDICVEDLLTKVEEFKNQGCTLFE